RRLQPFIPQQQHGLPKVQGREFGGGNGDQGIAEADLVIVEARPFAAEQQGGFQSPARRIPQAPGGLGGGQHLARNVAVPRGGGQDQVVAGKARRRVVMQGGVRQDVRRARGQHLGAVVGPFEFGRDQPQLRQAEILHGAGGGARIFAHLGVGQHDGGRNGRDGHG